MSVWDVGLQLEAWRQGRALPKVGRQLVIVNPNALVFCPLSMAGWDPSLQAVAVGHYKRNAQVVSCADPREWDLQLETFSRMRAVIEPWFEACYADGEGETFPQLIVPSSSAAKLLGGLAYRLAWLHVPEQAGKDRKRWTEDARQLGRLLLFFQQQLEIEGQQSVVVASRLLRDHFAFGQDATDHVGALLTWIDPPAGQDVSLAAIEAERETLGVRTTPEFDEELSELVDRFLKVKNGDPSRRSFAQRAIEDRVQEELLDPLWAAVHQAIGAVEQLNLAPLPALEYLQRRELRAFQSHMTYLRKDGRFAKNDKPRAAVRGLTVMEDASEQWAKARLWGDPVSLAKARFDGDVLCGTTRRTPDGLEIISNQRMLKVRRGDELKLMADPETVGLVEEIRRVGEQTVVRMGCDTELPDGQQTDWAGSPPAWHMLGIGLGKIFRRLSAQPDTHRPDSPGDRVNVPAMIVDPAQALERFAR
jgi:hypothetical protein